MQAEIIVVGDEILMGQTLDTNSAFIADQLNMNGIIVKQKRVIEDNAQAIKDALDNILPETGLIFITGGLGPTKDDLTKEALTEYFKGELVYHPEIYEHIEKLFASFNRKPSPLNKEQAYMPSCCEVIFNEVGTASGMRFEQEGKYYFALPGVPYETEHIVGGQIIPWISKNVQKGTVVHRTILTQGIPESELADKLSEWENNLPSEIKLAYLPTPGMVKLRLSSYIDDAQKAKDLIEREIRKAKKIIGNVIYGENTERLEEIIGANLKEKNATLSTAESCTGGYIAYLVTTIPGSSDYFMGGVVSYANNAKEDILNVEADLIAEKGPVSKEVVEQMALGAKKKFKTEFSIATSGIAGPTGGSEENPVGTVWIAVGTPTAVISKKFHFGKNREHNIRQSALMALDMLRREVQKFEI